MDRDAELRRLLSELVTNASRFTRLASSISPDTRPRTWTRALSLIEEYGPLRISDFARIDRCSQPSATALLKTLGEQGLVTRGSDPNDSRAVVVEMSDAGREWITDARYAIGDGLLQYLNHLEPEQIENIARGLDEIRGAVKTGSNT